MDLSVIIVNWNTRKLLQDCLQSIYDYTPCHETEVVVVDNDSRDGSPDMVREEFPQVKLLCNSKNVGFAGANNRGIANSQGKYVLLLNSDTRVKPQALDCLVEFMEAHPETGAAGSMLLNPDETLQTSCYPFPTIRRELWRLFYLDVLHAYGVYRMQDWDTNHPREVEHVQGASLILRRAALDQVGVLDEDYFMYSEELDLCYRLKNTGWKLFWVPQSRVIHYGGQSTKQAAQHMFLELYRSKILFFRKNLPHKTWIYKLSLFAASLLRVVLSPLAFLNKKEKRDRYLTMARYYFRLIFALPRM